MWGFPLAAMVCYCLHRRVPLGGCFCLGWSDEPGAFTFAETGDCLGEDVAFHATFFRADA